MARELSLETENMIGRIDDDGVGWMTYNNPARLNAMSMAMQLAVAEILTTFQEDDDVRVVVISGAGDRAFVSGADISEFGEKRTTTEARKIYDEAGDNAGRAYGALTKPIIAMIQGYCIGGGMLTALRADIRIASDDSQFGIPAAKLGLGYGYGGVEGLVQLVGPAAASEILFSARRFAADEALSMGLINRVVPVRDLEAAVSELAATIGANAPLTIAAAKAAIKDLSKNPDRRDPDTIAQMVEACFRSEDYLEGQAAFLEKRPANFQGR